MRILLWLSLGFAGGCALGCYFQGFSLYLVALALLAGIGLLLRLKAWRKALACSILGVVLGFSWLFTFHAVYLSPVKALDGNAEAVTFTATGYDTPSPYGSAVMGTMQLENKRYAVKIYLHSDTRVSPGDRITGKFSFRYTPGGQKEATYHKADKVFLLAYEDGGFQLQPGSSNAPAHLAVVLRHRILAQIEAAFPADALPFAKALLLGEDADIDFATNHALKLSGIRHVVAVSGLHISMLFALIYFITGRRPWAMLLLGVPVLLLFAAMVGFTPSIVRACVMQLLLLLSLPVKREYDAPTGLSLAALVILFNNPWAVTGVGFQLSMGSVMGIFLFAKPIKSRLDRLFRVEKHPRLQILTTSASISLSASSLTTPLVALYFGNVSLVSVVTNLLTLWIIPLIFCSIPVICLAGLFAPTLAQGLAWVIAWPIRYVLAVARLLSEIPMGVVFTCSGLIVLWLVLSYLLLGICIARKGKHLRLTAVVCVLTLGIAQLLSAWLPTRDNYRLTALDVGQGQCILLQSQGKTYMVDCGGSSNTGSADLAADTLRSQGIHRLDGLIVTHYDNDHSGGVMNLLDIMPTDTLFLPYAKDPDGIGEAIASHAKGTVITVDEPMVLRFGDSKLSFFPAESLKSGNESSLCVLFQRKNCDILITGDRPAAGELTLLQSGRIPKLDVLVAGHHGANSSTSAAFLAATQPETVIISVGKNNYYDHPATEVLQRLETAGCTVRRTDLEGTILIRG